jgi:hypothetical protein
MARVIEKEDGVFVNAKNQYVCGRRRRQCYNCGHKYIGKDQIDSEFHLWECPECGDDRHCAWPVNNAGEACKYHGGASPKGAEHYNYKHGAYSKWLPSDLASGYEEYMSDPDRMSLEREMALTRALIADRAQALNAVHSAEAWEQLSKLYGRLERAEAKKDADSYARIKLEMGKIIDAGAGLESTRKELKGLIDQERKLVDTERQLMIDMGELMTRGMVLMMFGNYMEAVKNNVLPLEGGAKAVTEIARTIRAMVGELGSGQSGRRSAQIEDSGGRLAG